MKKIFRKYGIVLPAAAIFWGIYISNLPIPDFTEINISYFITDKMLYGWRILWILYLIAVAGITYHLQNQKKWEYIYSFPMTKKQIYRQSFLGLYISMIMSAVIYGIFFYVQGMRIFTKAQQPSSIIELLASTFVNIAILFVWCAFTQLCMMILQYVWQGVVVSMILVFFGIPCIVSNFGYLIENVGHFKSREIFGHIFYGMDKGISLVPYLSNLCSNNYRQESAFQHLWTTHFTGIAFIISAFLLVLAFLVFFVAQKQFYRLDLSGNVLISRMKGKWNQIIPSLLAGIFAFHWITNAQMIGWNFQKGDRLIFFAMMFLRKRSVGVAMMPAWKVCMTFILSMVVMWGIIWILRMIRRKINEWAS